MSRYALISDIHANLPALTAVLRHIDGAQPVTACYHLGDLVGYGTSPNEVVGLLHAREIRGVAGNYDSTVATDYEHCGCKYENAQQERDSHAGFEWTKRNVSPETKARLADLPFRLDVRPSGGHANGPTLALVHGTPVLNTVYWTEDRSDDFCRKMAGIAGLKAGDVLAFGHTHKPWHRAVDGIHFVNTGSVGRPKDKDPRACYVTVDFTGGAPAVDFVRVEYDIERAAQGITDAGLPAAFAELLRSG